MKSKGTVNQLLPYVVLGALAIRGGQSTPEASPHTAQASPPAKHSTLAVGRIRLALPPHESPWSMISAVGK